MQKGTRDRRRCVKRATRVQTPLSRAAAGISEESSMPPGRQGPQSARTTWCLQKLRCQEREVDTATCQICIDNSKLCDPEHVPPLSLATSLSRTVAEARRRYL